MNVLRFGKRYVANAPAKINLFFEVLGRRDDGFHEIETLMCPISLYDTLSFTSRVDGQVRFACRQAVKQSGFSVPTDEGNLVVRAVRYLQQLFGVTLGADLHLTKRIPVAAGLGGGSSDAAAALCLANAAWGLGLEKEKLAEVAVQLGSDVPFFIYSAVAFCTGRGELIRRVENRARLYIVLAQPEEGLSTAVVYAACSPAVLPRSGKEIIDSLAWGKPGLVARLLFNRLQQPAVDLAPDVGRLLECFARSPALGSGMSGSGSACFGLYANARLAEREKRRIGSLGYRCAFTALSCH